MDRDFFPGEEDGVIVGAHEEQRVVNRRLKVEHGGFADELGTPHGRLHAAAGVEYLRCSEVDRPRAVGGRETPGNIPVVLLVGGVGGDGRNLPGRHFHDHAVLLADALLGLADREVVLDREAQRAFQIELRGHGELRGRLRAQRGETEGERSGERERVTKALHGNY